MLSSNLTSLRSAFSKPRILQLFKAKFLKKVRNLTWQSSRSAEKCEVKKNKKLRNYSLRTERLLMGATPSAKTKMATYEFLKSLQKSWEELGVFRIFQKNTKEFFPSGGYP